MSPEMIRKIVTALFVLLLLGAGGFLAGAGAAQLGRRARVWEIPRRSMAGLAMPAPSPTPESKPLREASPTPSPTPTTPAKAGSEEADVSFLPPEIRDHPIARLVWRLDPRLMEELRRRGALLPEHRECREEDDFCVFLTMGEAVAWIQRMDAQGRRVAAAFCQAWKSGPGGVPVPAPTPAGLSGPSMESDFPCVPGKKCPMLFDLIMFSPAWTWSEANDFVTGVHVFLFLVDQSGMDRALKKRVRARHPYGICGAIESPGG
jgi:hypothetical protein